MPSHVHDTRHRADLPHDGAALDSHACPGRVDGCISSENVRPILRGDEEKRIERRQCGGGGGIGRRNHVDRVGPDEHAQLCAGAHQLDVSHGDIRLGASLLHFQTDLVRFGRGTFFHTDASVRDEGVEPGADVFARGDGHV